MDTLADVKNRALASSIQAQYAKKALWYLNNKDYAGLKRLVEIWHSDTLVHSLRNGKG